MNINTESVMPLELAWVTVDGDSASESVDLPEKAPPSSLHFAELVYCGEAEVKSSHDVKKMCIVTKAEEGSIVYFKRCNESYPPILAQIEAAGSSSMRISRGNNAARVRPVVDTEGNVVGVASYEIATFEPLSKESLSAGVMVRMGIIDELVARYTRMEDDLHGDQMGIAKDLGIVGIDFDELWYSDITVEIKGPRAINNGILAPLPQDLFPVTDKDIDSFPYIKDAQPCHWPTKNPNNLAFWKRFPNRKEFIKLATDSMAIQQKYYAFLKDLLIDPKDHIKIMAPSFSKDEEGRAMIEKMKLCVEKRWDHQIMDGMIQNRGFRRFIVRNKTAILKILDHFKKYNREVAENGVEIKLEKVVKRFHNIVRKCMGKDLTMVLYDLGCSLKADRKQWEIYNPSYMKLIEACVGFEKTCCIFPEAFSAFEYDLNAIALEMRDRMEEWNLLVKNINQVVGNYRGLVAEKMGAPVQSIIIDRSRRSSLILYGGVLDKEKCIAKALQDFLADNSKHHEVIEIVQQVFDEYVPIGYSSTLGSVNPFTYTRTRMDKIEDLLKNLKALPGKRLQLISEFFDTGAWNISGYLCGASANVILIRRLVERTIEDFKSQMTLEQLRKHDFVEVCFAIEQKELDIEKSAKTISFIFQNAVRSKKTASSEFTETSGF